MYAEFAGEMAKAVGSVSEDIYMYVKAEQFKEKIENMDISIQSLPNINTTVDNDKELDGESVFKDIPLKNYHSIIIPIFILHLSTHHCNVWYLREGLFLVVAYRVEKR